MCRFEQASVNHIKTTLKHFCSTVGGEKYEIVVRAVDCDF